MIKRLLPCAFVVALLAWGSDGEASTNPWSALGAPAPSAGACGAKQTSGVQSMGGVNDVLIVGTDIYVAGCFTDWAGIAEADYVAKWNGSAWSALGSNGAGDGALNKVVYALASYKGSIVAAGEFTDAGGVGAADMVASFSSGTWSALPTTGSASPQNGPSDYASALFVDDMGTGPTTDDLLYVGGAFYYGISNGTPGFQIANTVNAATWDGTTWAAVDDSNPYDDYPNQTKKVVPQAIVKSGSAIYFGGATYESSFTCTSTCQAQRPAAMLTRLSGGTWDTAPSWSAAYSSYAMSGTGWGVFALGVIGTDVVVGGNFLNGAGVDAADYLAQFDTTGSTWGAFHAWTQSGGSGAVVSDLAVSGSDVYVFGGFPSSSSGSAGVGWWSAGESLWRSLGAAPVGSDPVSIAYAGAVSGSTVYVGGGFSDAAGLSAADRIARFTRSATATLDGWAPDTGSPSYTADGALSPEFASGTTSYTDTFTSATTPCSRYYTFTPTDLGASVYYTYTGGGAATIAGQDRLAFSAGGGVLVAGTAVTVTATVRSSDGSTTQTYTASVLCKRTQAITFPALADTSITAGTVALGATASSSLGVAYASATGGTCTVTDSTVTLVAAGTCTITASQPGNGAWAAAGNVERSFEIAAAPSGGGSSPPPSESGSGAATTTSVPAAPPAPSAPSAPTLGPAAVKAARATLAFAADSGTTYAITATKGKVVKTGSCKVAAGKATCVIKLAKGSWSIAVMPMRNGVKGTPAIKPVKVR